MGRFVKKVKMEDVRRGDVVDTVLGHRTITGVSSVRDPYVELFMEGGGSIKDWPNKEIRLVHRPRLEGKMRGDLLSAIANKAAQVENLIRFAQSQMSAGVAAVEILPEISDLEEALRGLREVMDAYELSKPMEKKSSSMGSHGVGDMSGGPDGDFSNSSGG